VTIPTIYSAYRLAFSLCLTQNDLYGCYAYFIRKIIEEYEDDFDMVTEIFKVNDVFHEIQMKKFYC
jgi:hypothetical protein